MKKRNYLLLMFFILLSCKSQNSDLYIFDPTKLIENKFTLSDIADDITYIPLDNSFPINGIYSPVFFYDNTVCLSALSSGVMTFDRTGKFLRKIGSIGRGPGEYNNYYNFTVDEKRGTVYVLDEKVIKVYSKSGNYLRSISLKEYGGSVDAIKFSDSELFLTYSFQFEDTRYDLIVLDSLGNLIKKKQRTDKPFRVNWDLSGGMYKLDNRICYWNPWRDTIFSILPDLKTEPSFLFSDWENKVPRSEITDLAQFQLFNVPNLIFETSQFIVIRYLFNKRMIIAMIDKESNKSYLTYLESAPAVFGDSFTGGILNDIDGGLLFQPENYFTENYREYLFGLINPIQLKKQVAGNEFKELTPKHPEKKKELIKLADRLKEADNPVLMVVTLKSEK